MYELVEVTKKWFDTSQLVDLKPTLCGLQGMGCAGSKIAPKYQQLMKTPEFEKWSEMFEALQLRQDEVKQLLRLYGKVDLDGGGTIDVVELLTVIDVERTPFTERIFSIFDEDGSGKIDFGEFVLALWNYCTLSKYALGITYIFSFRIILYLFSNQPSLHLICTIEIAPVCWKIRTWNSC